MPSEGVADGGVRTIGTDDGTAGGAGPDRRGFLRGASLAALGAALGTAIPFGHNMPAGLVPVALARDGDLAALAEKDGLTVLGERPLNAETPVTLLDPDVTPTEHFFIRQNGLMPETARTMDASGWRLKVDGEVETELDLSIDDLKGGFETVTQELWLECGGNGRSFFVPGASGNQWTLGAVGNARWTGVRLADVLERAGLKPSAVYTAHYGNDVHLSGDPEKVVISRGVPIEKAMSPESMIAWEMNGAPVPPIHGFPLRLLVPGYPGSASQKFLNRIWIRDREHDGPKMTGYSYRVPAYPVAPGTEVPEEDMVVLKEMPVKSIITRPGTGARVGVGEAVTVRGHAWSGKGDVARMDVSTDFGQTWRQAELKAPTNRFAWQRWTADVTLPEAGYYEVWARATDRDGVMQPPVVPGWNPRGYGNNMQHRIALFAA